MRAAVLVGRCLRALAALVLLDAVVIALPVLLWRVFDWPFAGASVPHSLPSWAQVWSALNQNGFPDAALIRGPIVVVWLCWLDLSYGVILHVVAAVRETEVRSRLARPLEWAAQPLVAALFVALSTMSTRFTAMDFGGTAATVPQLAVAAHIAGAPAAGPSGHVLASDPSSAAERVHVVHSGETMWEIAEHDLGSGPRYREIFALNQGHREPDGRVVRDPHWIYPGWRLAEPAAAPPPSAGAGVPALPAGTAPLPTVPTGPASPAPSVASVPSGAAGGAVIGTPVVPPSGPASPASPERSPVADDPAGGRGAAPFHIQAGSRPFVEVPGVGIVGLSLAAGVAAAIATARRHAWRRWRPGDEGASLRAVDALVTEPVLLLDRVHRRSQLVVLDDGAEPDPEELEDTEVPRADGPNETAIEVVGEVAWPLEVGFTAEGVANVAPNVGNEPTPGWVVAAELDGREVAVDIGALSGAGLEGPGAMAAAQAVILTFLTHADAEQVEMVVLAEAAFVLPGLERVPGVEVLPDLGAVLDRLEREARHREHILAEQDVADFTTLATSVPWELAVALLVVGCGDPGAHADRLRAVVERGRRLGICVLWLGGSPAGASITVAESGEVDAPRAGIGSLAALSGGRLPTLTPQAASALVEAVAAGRGAVPPPAPPAEVASDLEVALSAAFTTPTTEPMPQAVGDEIAVDGAPVAHTSQARISVLGPLRIWSDGAPVTLRRSMALQLLALFALKRDGITLEEALTCLFPDNLDRHRTHRRFRSELAHARKALQGAREGEHIPLSGGRYHLDPELVTIDLWEFEEAQRQLRATPSPSDVRQEALQRCAAAYGGELLQGETWDWVMELSMVAVREDIRRRASQALDELARMRQEAGDLEGAVGALEHALLVAPDAEDLQRRMMLLQAELGCKQEVRGVLRVVEARCADLGEQPEDETLELAHRLLSDADSSAH